MRNTKQKSLVLDIVSHSFSHPTALEIYLECLHFIPNISLGTVYRNLNLLEALGQIQKVEVPGGTVRYDRVGNHDHFVCVRCGKIMDLERKKISYDEMIDGNQILNCKVRYDGICFDCLNKKEGE